MSYGKIHRRFFDSSVNDVDPLSRLVFIGMIVLSDRHGTLDITVEALARKLNLDHEVVRQALAVLGSPDPTSRTPDHEGRRIIPIDGRAWGWVVVNKEQYRRSDDTDDERIRADATERKRDQRERDRSKESNSSSMNTIKETHILRDSHTSVTPSHTRPQEVTEKCDTIFSRCWALVPRKEGRKMARKHFDAEVRLVTHDLYGPDAITALDRLETDLIRAITNYAERNMKTEARYIMQGSRLFFNFRDYVNASAASTQKSARREEGLKGVAF
jgi:hypothetical protein